MDRSGYCASARSSVLNEIERETEAQWVAAESDTGAQWLPPGFRFHPTDEELIMFYLARKIQNPNFCDHAISEADLNKCEPWDLPGKAKMGEKEWYFYSLKDRKYPTGVRTNRATQAGYWKATGKDREVMGTGGGAANSSTVGSLKGKLVGMKKTLVFYTGRAPKGTKSNWVMHEYRAEDALKHSLKLGLSKDEWVLCRVFHKNGSGKKMALEDMELAAAAALLVNRISQPEAIDARVARRVTTLPPLTEVPWNPTPSRGPCSYTAVQSGNNGTAPSCAAGHGGLSMQACSYATGSQLPAMVTDEPGELQYLSAGATGLAAAAGSPIFSALYQHYDHEVNCPKPEFGDHCYLPFLQDDGHLPVALQGNLQMPVSSWAGAQCVDGTFGRPSPDSCASSLDFSPSSHAQHPVIARLPSDLERLFAT